MITHKPDAWTSGFILLTAAMLTIIFVIIEEYYRLTHKDKIQLDACQRFHPGESCRPGDNHPIIPG